MLEGRFLRKEEAVRFAICWTRPCQATGFQGRLRPLTTNVGASPDAALPLGDRLDAMAQKHFDRSDWIELAATVLLSLATIVAAWSAYQSTRWNGVQAENAAAASARRIEATQQNSLYTGQVQLDVIAWITYLEHLQAGDENGAAFLRDRFRDEFKPAFDAWLGLVPQGQIPPGTPFELAAYQPQSRLATERLNAEADSLSALAARSNQIGDNFVLVAVIMASVLFCAGVGTKVRGRLLRVFMLCLGIGLFIGGTWFMVSLPQSFGI
jgi:protein-S-isoprenylcysteine O-methyltransferase Ste14